MVDDRDLALMKARLADAVGDNVAAFARKCGWEKSGEKNLANWLANPASLKSGNLAQIARAAGRPISWFFGEEAPLPLDLAIIPRLSATASAGAGEWVDVVEVVDDLPFPRHFVERMAPRGAELQCLQARGDSMAPTIQDGALIVIDHKQTTLPEWKERARKAPRPHRQDAIYVFNLSGQVRVKRLRDLGDHFVALISDNAAVHPPEIIKRGRDGGFAVLGKVVWWEMRG